MYFSQGYMWFEPLNCLKIIENGKKYHIGEFCATAVTGWVLGPKKWVLMYEYWDI